MPVVGDLVQDCRGRWITLAPKRCPNGHPLGGRPGLRRTRCVHGGMAAVGTPSGTARPETPPRTGRAGTPLPSAGRACGSADQQSVGGGSGAGDESAASGSTVVNCLSRRRLARSRGRIDFEKLSRTVLDAAISPLVGRGAEGRSRS